MKNPSTGLISTPNLNEREKKQFFAKSKYTKLLPFHRAIFINRF